MNVKLIVIIAILATSALAKHKCNGLSVDFKEALERIDKKQGNDVITTEHLQKRQESLASGNFRPIKILMDLSGLNEGLDSKGMSDRKAFYKQVFEITSKWWESALLVNDDRTSIWPTILKIQKESDIEAEKEYIDFKLEGRDTSIYDLFIKVNLAKNEEEGTLAYAGPYLRHDKTQRPISGSTFVTLFGDNAAKEHSTPVQYAVETMVHEFGHIFGFISWKQFQPNYVGKANGKYIWKGPKTLALAKEFYGCPTMEGVPLETLNGKIGAHWNEEILASEMMTPEAGDHGDRLADLSLALLEDTAWYKADYSKSENFTHGKGGGCGAVTGNVVASKICPSPQACKSGTKNFIIKDYKGIGYCETNAHGCNDEKMYGNRDCDVEKSWPKKFKKKLGAHYGDGCAMVTANLKYKSKKGQTRTKNNVKLPVYSWCEDDVKSYTLAFTKFEYDSE